MRLFQAALKSILMDLPTSNTVKNTYKIKSYFQKKVEKSIVNTKIAVKFHVNRNDVMKKNGSHLASTVFYGNIFERYPVKHI